MSTAARSVAAWRRAFAKKVMHDAHALGAKFRIIGDEVEIEKLDLLPDELRNQLVDAQQTGVLAYYLGAEEPNIEAEQFLATFHVEPVLVEDPAHVASCIAELLADRDGDPGPDAAIGIDIETAPANWRPPPIRINKDGALSARQDKVDLPGLDPRLAEIQALQLYSGGERCFIFRKAALKEVLTALPSLGRLVAHNAAFEAYFLQCRAAQKNLPIECTRQASGLLYGVGNRSLADAVRNVWHIELPKDLQVSCWSAPRLSAGQIAYAATDAVLAYHLWPLLRSQLQDKRRWQAYELQTGVTPAVVDMQVRGVGIDRQKHAEQVDQWARELAKARRDYQALAGKPPPATPAELRAWIAEVAADKVGLGQWPLTPKGGELSIDRNHLKRLILSGNPTVKPVLSILSMEKLLTNFGPRLADFINTDTGRLHAHYNIAGAKSGRFTCSDPNLQQLPKRRAPEFRSCIVAASGNLLIVCDWNQIELRAAAWISGEPVWIDAFNRGLDLHRLTAADIKGIPYDAVTDAQRQSAKPVNFGAIYGIGPRKLAENAFANYDVEMTEHEAREALDRFFRPLHALARWRETNNDRCQRLRRVEIGCGRVVEAAWEIENRGHLTFNQACNLPIQGVCADAMMRALHSAHTRFAGLDAGLVAVIHDEIVVEAAERDAEKAKELLQECMTHAFVETFPGAPTTGIAEAGIGRSWYDARPK